MSDFLKVDIERLTSNGGDDIEFAEDNKGDKVRIQGLIRNNVNFSAIVYGYRGTGKTTFVDNILKDFQGKKVIIRFNATNYDSYPKFLKRFIRELYLAVGKVNDNSDVQFENLKNIYKHTFFNVTESLKEENIDATTRTKAWSFFSEASYEKTIDIFSLVLFLISAASTIMDERLTFGSYVMKFLQCAAMSIPIIVLNCLIKFVFKFSYEKKNSSTEETKKTKTEESLYDDEIAEYHVFRELEKISNENGKVIFVLDELDKLSDDDIKKVIRDLKPIILSEHIISILVAGKNYEKFLEGEQDDTDGIAGNLFSQKIYVPLADSVRADSIIRSMFIAGADELNERVNYINEKIIMAEGVIRNMINLIIHDIDWDDKVPKIMDKKNSNRLVNGTMIRKCFNGYSMVEEEVSNRFGNEQNSKTDEMYKLAYRVGRYIRENEVKLDEDQEKEAIEALKTYINDNTTHLDKKEIELVFYCMFHPKEDHEDQHAGDFEDVEVTNAEVKNEESFDEDHSPSIQAVINDMYGIKLDDEELENVTTFFFSINRLLGLFGQKIKEDCVDEAVGMKDLLNVFAQLELFHRDFSSFDECRKEEFSMTHEQYMHEVISEYHLIDFARSDVKVNESFVAAKMRVATKLLQIYYWKTLNLNCKYSEINNVFSEEIQTRWDIAHNDSGCFNLISVKYYMRNYTRKGTLTNAFADAKRVLMDKAFGNDINAVQVVFVPNAVNDALGEYKEYAKFLEAKERESTAENKRIHFSLCYIPYYGDYEEFSNGLDEFINIIRNSEAHNGYKDNRQRFMDSIAGWAKEESGADSE